MDESLPRCALLNGYWMDESMDEGGGGFKVVMAKVPKTQPESSVCPMR